MTGIRAPAARAARTHTARDGRGHRPRVAGRSLLSGVARSALAYDRPLATRGGRPEVCAAATVEKGESAMPDTRRLDAMELITEERLHAGDLVAALAARAPSVGANESEWPGLTVYRFTTPAPSQWCEVRSRSLCVVAQGQKAVMVGERRPRYDAFQYLVFSRGMRFQAEILEASIEKPFLSFVLQIQPGLVRGVWGDMVERNTTIFRQRSSEPTPAASLTPVDAGRCRTSSSPMRSARSSRTSRRRTRISSPPSVMVLPA
jgi:hypothetical protein